MWSIKNEKVNLNLSMVNQNEFNIISENGLHLVIPRRNLWQWKEKEKWLRSIIVDDDGFVVSCSWKKFGNYNEFKNDTNTLNKCLKDKPVSADTAYFSAKNLKACKEYEVDAYIPDPRFRKRDIRFADADRHRPFRPR